jgi:CarD family transcriptional regulator
MFNRNENVVYPGHGVAIIEDIIEKSVGGSNINFFKLTFLYKDMTILVPIYNAGSIGIRKPNTKEIVDAVINELYKAPEKKFESIDFTPSGWNRRNKDYQMRIQSGSLLEIAKIYRDLMHVAQYKELSFGERSLLQSTEELIVQELQVVLNQGKELVIQLLRRPFKQFVFQERTTVQETASAA